jgi:hypothetical protein
MRSYSQQKELDIVTLAYPSSCAENLSRKITVQASLGKNTRPYFKNNQSKKSRGYGSSSKGFA